MQVTVIGMTRQGLLQAVSLAAHGHRVVGLDVDLKRIEMMRRGKALFSDRGLSPLMARLIRSRHLTITDRFADAIPLSRVIILSLPAPPGARGLDGSALSEAVEALAPHLIHPPKVILDATRFVGSHNDRIRLSVARSSESSSRGPLHLDDPGLASACSIPNKAIPDWCSRSREGAESRSATRSFPPSVGARDRGCAPQGKAGAGESAEGLGNGTATVPRGPSRITTPPGSK